FFFQAEDGIRDWSVTGVQTCALPIWAGIEGLVSAIEAGNQEPRRQFIAERLFLPTSDKGLVNDVLGVMMAAPAPIAANAMKGIRSEERRVGEECRGR